MADLLKSDFDVTSEDDIAESQCPLGSMIGGLSGTWLKGFDASLFKVDDTSVAGPCRETIFFIGIYWFIQRWRRPVRDES